MYRVNEPDEMARFQTFWIQMPKNKPLDKSRKTRKYSGTKMSFYFKKIYTNLTFQAFIFFSREIYVKQIKKY
ncbi:hypothetical protein Hanom_Chr15g01338671 [Helianthus anomalus]